MKFPRVLLRYIVCCLLAATSSIASAELLPDELPYSSKVSSENIFIVARQNHPQELILEVDAGSFALDIAKSRKENRDKNDALRKGNTLQQSKLLDDEQNRADANAVQHLQAHLKAIKDQVLARQNGSVLLVRDYPSSTTALIRVPDKLTLLKLLADPLVKMVYEDEVVHGSAYWPNNYSDLSIIGTNSITGATGRKGSNTRVVVIDYPANLLAIPGWDGSASGACTPYDSMSNFHEEYLGNGGLALSKNCRVWSAYNFAPATEPYCGAPVYLDGANTPRPCMGSSDWPHGTVDGQIVARTAPGTWLTMLQVFDASNSTTAQNIQAALDWVTQHANDTPRIAAVNLSINTNQKFSGVCQNSVFSAQLQAIIAAGIVPVVSSGNNGWKDGVADPACVPGVLSVGATTDSTVVAASTAQCSDPALESDAVPCFSNSAPILTMLAPGVKIGNPSELAGQVESGTSMAAAHVAGAVAIMKGSDAYGSTKSVAQIISLLSTTGIPVVDYKSHVSKNRLDIGRALSNSTGSPIVAYKMVLSPGAMKLSVGQSSSFNFTSYDRLGTQVGNPPGSSQVWTSNNPSVLYADGFGGITAVAAGTAQLHLYDPLVSNPDAVAIVTVTPAPVLTTLSATPNPVGVNYPGSTTVVLSGLDQTGAAMPLAGTTTWSSANPAVASVDSGGHVVAVSAGTTTLSATNSGVSVSIPVTVSPRPGINPPPCGRACSGAIPPRQSH